MSKRDDVNSLYIFSNRLNNWCKYLFFGNCVITFLASFCIDEIKDYLILGQLIGALLYVMLSNIDDGLFWYDAEMARRKNNIQVAFNLPLSELETDGYYNNSIEPSIAKYAANSFESNFFSKFIAEKMLIKSAIKSVISIIVLIITGWVISNGDVLLIMTQSVFSVYVIEDTIMLTIYKSKMDKIYDEAFSEFVSIGIENKKQIVKLLSYAVEYEAIKAHYKVRLDTKLFNTYNEVLSERWNAILQSIHIDAQANVF